MLTEIFMKSLFRTMKCFYLTREYPLKLIASFISTSNSHLKRIKWNVLKNLALTQLNTVTELFKPPRKLLVIKLPCARSGDYGRRDLPTGSMIAIKNNNWVSEVWILRKLCSRVKFMKHILEDQYYFRYQNPRIGIHCKYKVVKECPSWAPSILTLCRRMA